jgi:hypothetical protein
MPSFSSENVSTSPFAMKQSHSKSQLSLQGPMHSLRRLFGRSAGEKEEDVEVHVSVITQHGVEVELSDVGDGRTRQEDSESIDQVEPVSEWYR